MAQPTSLSTTTRTNVIQLPARSARRSPRSASRGMARGLGTEHLVDVGAAERAAAAQTLHVHQGPWRHVGKLSGSPQEFVIIESLIYYCLLLFMIIVIYYCLWLFILIVIYHCLLLYITLY